MNKVVRVKSISYEDFAMLLEHGFSVQFASLDENIAALDEGDATAIIAFERMLAG